VVQAQGDVRVLGGVGAGFFQVDLVERELFCAFAGDGFVADGLLIQVDTGQAVHVVAGRHGVIDVGLQHGVFGNAFEGNAMVGQHILVVLQVLADFFLLGVFQQWLELLKHSVPVQLIRGAHVVVGQGYVGGFAGFNGEGHADHLRVDIAQAGGLGVEGEQR